MPGDSWLPLDHPTLHCQANRKNFKHKRGQCALPNLESSFCEPRQMAKGTSTKKQLNCEAFSASCEHENQTLPCRATCQRGGWENPDYTWEPRQIESLAGDPPAGGAAKRLELWRKSNRKIQAWNVESDTLP